MALCQEKHIDELYLLDRLEQSLAKSYSSILKREDGSPVYSARVTIDRATGRFYVYELVPKEESYDEELDEYTEFDEIDRTPNDMSRIAAQHAKAEIMSIVRNAAREQVYQEFSSRIGDIITGTVLQSTPDFTIIKIREGVEAELPHFDRRRYPDERNERPQGERYSHNQRLRAIIIDVRDPNANVQPVRGERSRPSIVVSRTHPDLIRRLFELEVPEIYDGVVEVRSIAREPGARSKVAVASLDERLDPVGACVGPKGSRVRTVVSELRGERVDVIATMITMGGTIADLKDLELCYAPLFSTAKDVVNFAALIAENVLTGRMPQVHVSEVRGLVESGAYIVDVREEGEFARGHLKGAHNVPLSQLRSRMDEIPRDVPVYLHCRSSQRSYYALCALRGNGWTNVVNISGSFLGISLYEYFNDKALGREPIVTAYNCN